MGLDAPCSVLAGLWGFYVCVGERKIVLFFPPKNSYTSEFPALAVSGITTRHSGK